MKKEKNLNNAETRALNIHDVSIRLMTFEEIFESRMEYFVIHSDNFSDSQFRFLKSIQHHRMGNGLTKKQMRAFISTVDSVMFNQNRYRLK